MYVRLYWLDAFGVVTRAIRPCATLTSTLARCGVKVCFTLCLIGTHKHALYHRVTHLNATRYETAPIWRRTCNTYRVTRTTRQIRPRSTLRSIGAPAIPRCQAMSVWPRGESLARCHGASRCTRARRANRGRCVTALIRDNAHNNC